MQPVGGLHARTRVDRTQHRLTGIRVLVVGRRKQDGQPRAAITMVTLASWTSGEARRGATSAARRGEAIDAH